MKIVTDWRDPDFDHLPVGGKARALGALSRAGFPVPPWCVVLPAAAEVDPLTAEAAIKKYLQQTMPRFTLLAVRSSALDEDGQAHSFAGQLDSYLEVPLPGLFEKIQAVWRSGFSERILRYREQAGLSLSPPTPAVILQHMVAAEMAGVAFSADPVTGRRGVAVIAAVRGLGDALVSGAQTGDSYQIDRAGRIIARETSTPPVLTDAEALEAAALARQAARHFGAPQDIEWAFAGAHLYLLQSRPITSLAALHDPDGAWQLWDNSNIAESYSGVTTPLTFSFAREIYEEVYYQFVQILRVPARRIEANRDVFGRMLGLIRGRVYYNLLSWYRVLAMLPGFAVNRRFMEQMMGVKESLPEDVVAGIAGRDRSPGFRDYLEAAGTVVGLLINHLTLPNKIAAFHERLEQALDLGPIPLEEMRADELAAAYRRLQNQLLTRWDAPLINDFFAMIYFGLSRKLVREWCADEDGTLQNDLIARQGGIISAEPAKRIMRLAALARETPDLLALLEEGSLADIEQSAEQYPEFFRQYRDYLQVFGDRCLEELKLESATLHDDPLMLLRSVARLAQRPAGAPLPSDEAVAASAERRVEEALVQQPLRRSVFHFVMNQARDRVRDRENLRFERTRVFGRVRRIFVELGKRLHDLGALDDPRDVFYLETEEVLGFVEGASTTTHLAALARLRREEFATFHEDPPAGRFETRGVVYVGHTFQPPEGSPAAAAPTGEERKGLGCCPGFVKGRARVILDPRHAEIEPGEILVAPRTDPGWIMLFPSAAGLLVEHGSLLSHSAIVAREMGIPAIVAVPGLTEWLRTGDEVELNGGTGWVLRLQPAEQPRA